MLEEVRRIVERSAAGGTSGRRYSAELGELRGELRELTQLVRAAADRQLTSLDAGKPQLLPPSAVVEQWEAPDPALDVLSADVRAINARQEHLIEQVSRVLPPGAPATPIAAEVVTGPGPSSSNHAVSHMRRSRPSGYGQTTVVPRARHDSPGSNQRYHY